MFIWGTFENLIIYYFATINIENNNINGNFIMNHRKYKKCNKR